MYITPNTTIKLLSDVPLEPDYVHTLYFASKSAQSSYFNTKVKYTLNSYTYQRYGKGALRVQLLADNLYDVNYLMFQNTAFGNKWFYAFVDHVEYINDVTSEVYYHIDEIQTWLLDTTFNQCFIERQHSTTDVIGDNILPEPVEVGEYVYTSYTKDVTIGSTGLKERAIIVAITEVDDNTSEYVADGQVYDGVYGACKLFAYSFDHIQDVNQKISEYAAKAPDSVVSVYMIPKALVIGDIDTGNRISYGSSGGLITGLTLDPIGVSLDGYVPKNQKLFTYPYNYQSITTGNGEELALRYEFFVDRIPKVNLFGCISQPVQVVCCPTNYKNVNKPEGALSSYPNFVDEKIVLTSFPVCSWNIDTWRAWVSQNAIPTLIKAGSVGASIALAAYTPAHATEVASSIVNTAGKSFTQTQETPASLNVGSNAGLYALHTATSILTTMYKASIAADQTKGSISSANALYSEMEYTLHHGRKTVNAQQAAVIDSFFTRFGYAYNKLGTPNIHARTSFTYVKTLDCTVHGDLPADSEKIIEDAFNSGITFWVNPSNVGDYSVSNLTL